jgi:trehalose-6-phosphate synthase
MNEICIHLPPLPANHTIELEIKADGKKRLMNYRVERFDWTAGGTDPAGRIERLRQMIRDYDPQWELVQIGVPSSDDLIPVMFRQHA